MFDVCFDVSRSVKVNFYGLRDLPEPLLAEYNIKGKLTQLNLVNDTLLQVLQSHLNCKASPLLVSVGIPLFKLLDDNFMTNIDVPSRWRPAMEGASILAKKMEKRVLRINLERMRKLPNQAAQKNDTSKMMVMPKNDP